MALPSEWLFLDRDDVFDNESARQRAWDLYSDVARQVAAAPEFGNEPGPHESSPSDRAGQKNLEWWHIMAEVAESYPRMLVWLTEGQAGSGSNVFGLFIAILRVIPGIRKVLRRLLFDPVKTLAPWRPALYEAYLQRERSRRNWDKVKSAKDGTGERFASALVIPAGGTPGLSAVTDVAVVTPTSARDQLRDKIVRMASGCVGVSGLRGAGKTTLIRDFCAHRYGTPRNLPKNESEPTPLPGLRFVVDAPQRFHAQDFLVYLYSSLCQVVLTDVRFNTRAAKGRVLNAILLTRRIQLRDLLGTLAGSGLAVLAVGLIYQAARGPWPMPPWHDPFFWEVTGAVACLVGFLLAVGWRARQALREVRQVVDLPAETRERLRRLHYQRTDSVSRGGTVAGPFGIGVNVGDSRSLTENLLSMPELIGDYRDFVERVVAALVEAEQDQRRRARQREGIAEPDAMDEAAATPDVRLIIGIDAMDQIDDPVEAGKSLDELAAVFGTPNCVYLLSVQPATLAAVDQRTVPLKTSSAGLFDEMVWVDALRLPEAARIMDGRVTGMPAAFIGLCYALSGGLPRELLRVARAVCGVKVTPDMRGTRTISLKDAVTSVINDEVLALRHRTMASAASLDIGATPGWLKLIDAGDWLLRRATGPHHAGVHWIQSLLDEVGHPWAASQVQKTTQAATDLCDTLLAGLYFLLTVSELFTADPELINTLVRPHASNDHHWLCDSPPVLTDLASARAALIMNPYLAASHVHAARRGLLAHTQDKALTAEITVPFLRLDVGGAGLVASGG
jgi:hypothetical protein